MEEARVDAYGGATQQLTGRDQPQHMASYLPNSTAPHPSQIVLLHREPLATYTMELPMGPHPGAYTQLQRDQHSYGQHQMVQPAYTHDQQCRYFQPTYDQQQLYRHMTPQAVYIASAGAGPQTTYGEPQPSQTLQSAAGTPAPFLHAPAPEGNTSVFSTRPRDVSASSSSSSLDPTSPVFIPNSQGHTAEPHQKFPRYQSQPLHGASSSMAMGIGYGPGPSVPTYQETFFHSGQRQMQMSYPVVAEQPPVCYNIPQASGYSSPYQVQGMQQIFPAAPFADSGLDYHSSQSIQPHLYQMPYQQAPYMALQHTSVLQPVLPPSQPDQPCAHGSLMTDPPADTAHHRRNTSGRGARRRRQRSRKMKQLAPPAYNPQTFSSSYGQYGAVSEAFRFGTHEPSSHSRVASEGNETALSIGGRIVPGGSATPLQTLGPIQRALRTDEIMRAEERKLNEKRLFKSNG
ncbi:hypothetical protein K490DRAFT_68142 [Saccharata proteae CBS 121410]|uniref:Uncharacterized protein n=1 Tax=Saccharata proteae CBS 121410 TaxID=1314787 RepID=A0A9P4HNH2_9PEZI|nr:hypothetical protein K490DRAFT_68142 [Saccharata proteae CBS 121410]